MKRGEIRQRFGIAGDEFHDFCCHFWCTPCCLAQEQREIKMRQGQFGLQSGVVVIQQIVSQPLQPVMMPEGGMMQPAKQY